MEKKKLESTLALYTGGQEKYQEGMTLRLRRVTELGLNKWQTPDHEAREEKP
jgi:hypothetical protein